jgi:hypothetical protein
MSHDKNPPTQGPKVQDLSAAGVKLMLAHLQVCPNNCPPKKSGGPGKHPKAAQGLFPSEPGVGGEKIILMDQPAGSSVTDCMLFYKYSVGATEFRLGIRVPPRSWDPAWQENPVFKEELARKVTRLFARDGAATRDNITPRIGSQDTGYRFRQRSGR